MAWAYAAFFTEQCVWLFKLELSCVRDRRISVRSYGTVLSN